MKYIKTYESTEVDITGFMSNLKKYVIWETNLQVWYILETFRINFKSVTFKRLYSYYPSLVSRITGKLGEIEEIHNKEMNLFSNDEVKKRVIFESDNLNDCLDFELLSTIKDQNKFNL